MNEMDGDYMEDERDIREKRIESLKAMAVFILVLSVTASVIILIRIYLGALNMPYSQTPSNILLNLISSFALIIIGYLIYQYLIVFCDTAKAIKTIHDRIDDYDNELIKGSKKEWHK